MNPNELVAKMDAIVDTYHGQSHPLPALIDLRRELAGNLYSLTGYVKKSYGQAGLTEAKRKWAFSRAIVNARQLDAKTPFNMLQVNAEASDEIKRLRDEEVMAEAGKDALKTKIDATKEVLSAMQQEIAVLTHEYKTTHFQTH